MELEAKIGVLKLIAYLLILAGIIILFSAIMYFLTVPLGCLVICGWPSYVGFFVAIIMLGFGVAIRNLAKKADELYQSGMSNSEANEEDTPLGKLKIRYATGDISEEAFNKIKKDLE
jgi:uncharacterized membrane protein